jgi:hypothetical protein
MTIRTRGGEKKGRRIMGKKTIRTKGKYWQYKQREKRKGKKKKEGNFGGLEQKKKGKNIGQKKRKMGLITKEE